MDRNTVIGIVLIVGIVLTWGVITNSNREEETGPRKRTVQTDSTTQTEPLTETQEAVVLPPVNTVDENGEPLDSLQLRLQDSLATRMVQEGKFGYFVDLSDGDDKTIEVTTDKLAFELHSKGGVIKPLILREFMTHDSVPLPLVTGNEYNSMFLTFQQMVRLRNMQSKTRIKVDTRDLYLVPDFEGSKLTLSGDESKEIRFRGSLGDNRYFDFIYTIYGDSYDIGFDIEMKNMNKVLVNGAYSMSWQAAIPKTEKAMTMMRDKTAIYYRASGDVDNLDERSIEKVSESLTEENVEWVAFKSQFFSQTLFVNGAEGENAGFSDLTVAQTTPQIGPDGKGGDVVRVMEMKANGVVKEQNGVFRKSYTLANIPLEYSLLEDYGNDMTRQIALGWGPLKYVNMYLIIPVFDVLENVVGNYGIIILILALMIKLLLYPLTWKTYISSAKMRVINKTPEIKELEERYKDDPTKLQQEKMKIYRLMGVNMFGGCIPMILQYPFLISLFFLFPNLIELRQESFLWAEDLSTYDSIADLPFNVPFYGDHVSLFTLLMTVSIFFYTMINQRMQGQTVNNPVMKYFPYIMPLFLLGFLNNYSAGLSWYYFISNIISITQAQVSKLFIDEEKLLDAMRNTAKVRKSKGKTKSRLEKWAEKQQQKQQATTSGGRNGSSRPSQGRGGGRSRKK